MGRSRPPIRDFSDGDATLTGDRVQPEISDAHRGLNVCEILIADRGHQLRHVRRGFHPKSGKPLFNR